MVGHGLGVTGFCLGLSGEVEEEVVVEEKEEEESDVGYVPWHLLAFSRCNNNLKSFPVGTRIKIMAASGNLVFIFTDSHL